MLSQRLVVLLLVLSMIWPLLCAVYLYIGNHADLLKGIGVSPDFLSFIRGDGIFLAALIGPGCIAPDLANNALPLYFSRPITRGEYALGRLVTLVGLLSIITWIPGMLLFIMQASMAGWSWFSENWGIGTGIFAGFAVWILLVSLVALTSSAYAKMKVIAGGIVLGFFFILSGASNIINVVFRSKSGFIINPSWATRRLWYAMLEVDPPEGPGVLFCLCALVVLFLLLALILERKLRPVEVIT